MKIKRMVRWVREGIMRWRQRVDEIQYHDGYHWAKDVYFRGDLSFQALLDAATPVTCAFERGVMQAVIDIERDNNPEPEVNEVGEPVGVPFFIHPSNLPPPKSEEEELYYINPHIENLNQLQRRSEYLDEVAERIRKGHIGMK